MRKQELVHLHALCTELRRYLESTQDGSAEPFGAYEDCGVSPSAIHCRKEAHRNAVFHLLDGLVTVAEEGPSGSERSASRSGADGYGGS